MVKNDGSRKNEKVFWDVFAGLLGAFTYDHIADFDAFYTKEFHKAVAFTAPTELAAKAVALAREKADRVVLATNPFFPRVAVNARLSWTGITEDAFDLITDYGNSSYCKPNPVYYLDICKKMGVEPSRCLMIGNDRETDIAGAKAAGMSTLYMHTALTPAHQAEAEPSLHPDRAEKDCCHFEFEGDDWSVLAPCICRL